jgi:type IV fimbrial biogenesis protein FimT
MLVMSTLRPRCAARQGAMGAIRGFTLIELVVSITVLAIIVGLALPSFRAFVANQRIRNASFDLMAALTLARSEAITRGVPVNLQKTQTTWDQGWTVKDTISGQFIQIQDAYNSLTITDSASLAAITYNKDGRATAASSTKFTVALPTAINGVSSRCISIGLSGVPSSSVLASGGTC